MQHNGIGSYSQLGGWGYLSYQDTFVWKKIHSYGVKVKLGADPPVCEITFEAWADTL